MPAKTCVGTAGWSIPRAEQPHLRTYYSSYDADYLEGFADQLRDMRRRRIPSRCIFDNTAHGAATGNALSVIERLE